MSTKIGATLLTTTVFALLAGAVSAATLDYSFTIIEPTGFSNGTSGEGRDYSINNQGTAAKTVIGGFPTTISIVNVDRDNNRTVLQNVDADLGPVINDAGQYLTENGVVLSNGGVIGQLVRLEADGSTTVLAQSDPRREGATHPNTFQNVDVFRSSINANGEVAAAVITLDGARQIVKFALDGSSHTVLAESGDDLGFGFAGVDINDHGQVAFQATQNGRTGIFVASDETDVRVALSSANLGGSGSVSINSTVSINNDGDVLGTTTDGLFGTRTVVFSAGDTPSSDVEVIDTVGGGVGAPSVLANNLNNFDQAAYKVGGSVVIDGERLIGSNDTLQGLIIGQEEGFDSPIANATIRQNVNFNDLGQAIIDIRHQDGTRTIVRADPEGATFDNPLIPFASTPEGENDVVLNIVNGLGVLAPIFVDPIVATGFTYTQGVSGENFASLLIPEALPLGDDEFTVEFTAGGALFSETLFSGQSLDFTSFDPLGIAMFSILGIDIAEAVDPTDPFIVGLTFVDGGFSSTLSIDAITVDTDVAAVPLPASFLLLLAGIGGFGIVGFRRKAHAA